MEVEPRRRMLVKHLNEHITCVLCGGYLVDATTLVDCLHTFCKSCIVEYLRASVYCPVCDGLIHDTNPFLQLRQDRTVQDLIYKLVPGLLSNELKRRKEYFMRSTSRGGSAVCELSQSSMSDDKYYDGRLYTEVDEINVLLEFSADGKPVRYVHHSDKSASSEQMVRYRRYLLCPASFSIKLLKKFLRLKFNIDPPLKIAIFHAGEALNDYYSLMDVAYIYTLRRNMYESLTHTQFSMIRFYSCGVFNCTEMDEELDDGPLRLHFSVYKMSESSTPCTDCIPRRSPSPSDGGTAFRRVSTAFRRVPLWPPPMTQNSLSDTYRPTLRSTVADVQPMLVDDFWTTMMTTYLEASSTTTCGEGRPRYRQTHGFRGGDARSHANRCRPPAGDDDRRPVNVTRPSVAPDFWTSLAFRTVDEKRMKLDASGDSDTRGNGSRKMMATVSTRCLDGSSCNCRTARLRASVNTPDNVSARLPASSALAASPEAVSPIGILPKDASRVFMRCIGRPSIDRQASSTVSHVDESRRHVRPLVSASRPVTSSTRLSLPVMISRDFIEELVVAGQMEAFGTAENSNLSPR